MIRYLTFHEGILNWWCIGYMEQVGALFYVGVNSVGNKYHHMMGDRICQDCGWLTGAS